MEYLHRVMQNMIYVPNFNFHSKCEMIHLINLSFVDDLLLFARGDTTYVQKLMNIFSQFSKSTYVNTGKYKAYFGGRGD